MSRTSEQSPKKHTAGFRSVLLTVTASHAAMFFMGGCYERVISARGFGADQYNVSESYQSSSAIDDWVFGKQPRAKKTYLPGE